ncbi:MAG: hypothetical protein M1817_006794 [Caeruleum heppii]|nr:MAG: hypothetical protein M1817_006794 [Caeruleum heppii]
MDTLSTELLRAILAYLPIREIKAFRRCCTRFARVGIEDLFKTVIVYQLEDSYEKLTQLSRDPVIQHLVCKVIYCGPLFLDRYVLEFPEQFAWQIKPKTSYDLLFLAQRKLKYAELYHDQESVMRGPACVERLEAAFRRLSKLTKVLCGSLDHETMFQRGPISDRAVYRFSSKTTATTEHMYWLNPIPSVAVMNLLQAILRSGAPVETLNITGELCHDQESPTSPLVQQPESTQQLGPASMTLQEMRLDLVIDGFRSRNKVMVNERVLQAMPFLRVLEIRGRNRMNERYFYKHTFIHETWPELQVLRLSWTRDLRRRFLAFLHRHRYTLRTIELSHIDCDTKYFEVSEMFTALKGGSVQSISVEYFGADRSSWYVFKEDPELNSILLDFVGGKVVWPPNPEHDQDYQAWKKAWRAGHGEPFDIGDQESKALASPEA